jgi:hypothetical protein
MTAVQSAEPISQASANGYAYESVIGGKDLRHIGHRPSVDRYGYLELGSP